MKAKRFTVAVMLTAIMVTGCASSGHEVDQSKVDQIKKGVTTKDQVREWLGTPEQIIKRDGGDDVWVYAYAHASAEPQNFIPYVGLFVAGYNTESESTAILFGSNGIVKSLSRSHGGSSTDTNLSAGGTPKAP